MKIQLYKRAVRDHVRDVQNLSFSQSKQTFRFSPVWKLCCDWPEFLPREPFDQWAKRKQRFVTSQTALLYNWIFIWTRLWTETSPVLEVLSDLKISTLVVNLPPLVAGLKPVKAVTVDPSRALYPIIGLLLGLVEWTWIYENQGCRQSSKKIDWNLSHL